MTHPLQDAELDLRFQSLLTQQEQLDKAKASIVQEKKELDVLANKIKDDVSLKPDLFGILSTSFRTQYINSSHEVVQSVPS